MKRLVGILIALFLFIAPVFSANLSDLDVKTLSVEHDSFWDRVCATGYIMNNSDEYVNIELKINLYDAKGNYTETQICEVDGLNPHTLWRFVSEPIKQQSKTMKIVSIQIK